MKIGIVGARNFKSLHLVGEYIDKLPLGTVIISGGAKGVDTAAKNFGKNNALEVIEYLPNLIGCSKNYEFTQRYYERNQKIVDNCDKLVAFTDEDNGGTWFTIRYAKQKAKPVEIIRS